MLNRNYLLFTLLFLGMFTASAAAQLHGAYKDKQGLIQYKYTADDECGYETSTRTLCNNGEWSEWDQPCPDNICSNNECWNGTSCESKPAAPVCLKDLSSKPYERDLWGKQCTQWACKEGEGFVCMKYREIGNSITYSFEDGEIVLASPSGNVINDGHWLGFYPWDDCAGKNWWERLWSECANKSYHDPKYGITKSDVCPSGHPFVARMCYQYAPSKGITVKNFCGVSYIESVSSWGCYHENPDGGWNVARCDSFANFSIQEKDGPIYY